MKQIEMIDFSLCEENERLYRGEAGRKYGIEYEGEPWIIKFPKPTAGFESVGISYTTSPLSEYLGSKIYASLGIDVHETKLGFREGKIVVACRDFTNTFDELVEFREIKNAYLSKTDSTNDGTGSSSRLSEILDTINNSALFSRVSGARERFWDMFVIDALIGNPDRNNTNWGLIKKVSVDTGTMPRKRITGYDLAPVYDNGNSFFNKRSDAVFANRIHEADLLEDGFMSNESFYTSEESGRIKPFAYLAATDERDALAATVRIYEQIDIPSWDALLNSVPATFKGKTVITEPQREFYKALLKTRVEAEDRGLASIAKRARSLSLL